MNKENVETIVSDRVEELKVEEVKEVKDEGSLSPLMEKRVVTRLCGLLLFAGWLFTMSRGNFIVLFIDLVLLDIMNWLAIPFFLIAERIASRVVEGMASAIGIPRHEERRMKNIIPPLLGAMVVFVMSKIFLNTVLNSKMSPISISKGDFMELVMRMGFESLIYSRSISMALGRTPSIGRIIITALLMVFMGAYIFRNTYTGSPGHYDLYKADIIGKSSWDSRVGKYVTVPTVKESDMPEGDYMKCMCAFSKVDENIISSVHKTLGDQKFCNAIYMVNNLSQGQVEFDLSRGEVFISTAHEETKNEEVLKKVFRAIGYIQGDFLRRVILLMSILIPIGALAVVAIGRLSSNYIDSRPKAYYDEEDEGRRQRGIATLYVVAYFVSGLSIVLISLLVYKMSHMRVESQIQGFVGKRMDVFKTYHTSPSTSMTIPAEMFSPGSYNPFFSPDPSASPTFGLPLGNVESSNAPSATPDFYPSLADLQNMNEEHY